MLSPFDRMGNGGIMGSILFALTQPCPRGKRIQGQANWIIEKQFSDSRLTPTN
ncbi:MAG: hypothetical protein JEZ06_16775 [Anaerolineaceae bacterium]|nr:hypothetical protein [Anaerolineaceae bacterium]